METDYIFLLVMLIQGKLNTLREKCNLASSTYKRSQKPTTETSVFCLTLKQTHGLMKLKYYVQFINVN